MVYRIDEFLRDYDFSAAYEIRIDAPALVVYQCLLGSDFSKLWLARFLMTVRSGKQLPRNRMPATSVSGSKVDTRNRRVSANHAASKSPLPIRNVPQPSRSLLHHSSARCGRAGDQPEPHSCDRSLYFVSIVANKRRKC